jgi:mRNA-degrading endonuclease RelE of RelBE toxin-antitoxin system
VPAYHRLGHLPESAETNEECKNGVRLIYPNVSYDSGANAKGRLSAVTDPAAVTSWTDGQVLRDGRDSRHFAANELRAYFGVVPQETTQFSGTVYDNLILANPFATFEQVVRASRYAEIHESIVALAGDPRPAGGEKLAGRDGYYRLRQGDFRVVHSIDDHKLEWVVVKAGQRRDVYR